MRKGNLAAKKPNSGQVKSMSEKRDTDFGHEETIQYSQPSTCSDDGETKTKTKKRTFPDDDSKDFSAEMQKMLECFGADITKTLCAKRKRLETYTQNSLKTSNKKVEEFWRSQHADRKKLNEEFMRQMTALFTQWEIDIEKSKEQEEKLQSLFKQQQKMFQQARIIQSQRLKTIHQLHDQYMKGMESLEKTHQEQQNNVYTELRKEMALLQKKILIDTQQQEMMNVRKSLQTMLF